MEDSTLDRMKVMQAISHQITMFSFGTFILVGYHSETDTCYLVKHNTRYTEKLTLNKVLSSNGSHTSFSTFPPVMKVSSTISIRAQEKRKLNPTPLKKITSNELLNTKISSQ